MPDNNLDAEIQQWLAAATASPELVIPPLESDVIKGDIDGHEFHGNQWSHGEGGGGTPAPRRSDPGRYPHRTGSKDDGHKFNGSQWVPQPPTEPLPDSKEQMAHGGDGATIDSLGSRADSLLTRSDIDYDKEGANADTHAAIADEHTAIADEHHLLAQEARINGDDAGAKAHEIARDAHDFAAESHRSVGDGNQANQETAYDDSKRAAGASNWVSGLRKSVGEIEEWDVAKGGEGSGEHMGHPFRGNKWSSGLFNTAAHNEYASHRLTPMQAHLNDAIGHQHAAQQALHEGRFGRAMHHFNKAAMHFGAVARKSEQGGKSASQTIHQKAAEGYAAAHHAGDMAEYASLKVNDFARAMRQGNDDPTTLMMLSGVASEAQSKAHETGDVVSGIASQFSRMRLGDAMAGAARAVAGR